MAAYKIMVHPGFLLLHTVFSGFGKMAFRTLVAYIRTNAHEISWKKANRVIYHFAPDDIITGPFYYLRFTAVNYYFAHFPFFFFFFFSIIINIILAEIRVSFAFQTKRNRCLIVTAVRR